MIEVEEDNENLPHEPEDDQADPAISSDALMLHVTGPPISLLLQAGRVEERQGSVKQRVLVSYAVVVMLFGCWGISFALRSLHLSLLLSLDVFTRCCRC
jgi:hypothetical protein